MFTVSSQLQCGIIVFWRKTPFGFTFFFLIKESRRMLLLEKSGSETGTRKEDKENHEIVCCSLLTSIQQFSMLALDDGLL